MSALELPLGIDLHVHFRTPGHEYKETIHTGYQAALKGGIGTVVDMPNTNPTIDTLEIYNQKLEMIRKYPFLYQAVAITDRNVQERSLDEVSHHAKIYKLFMANSTGDLGISYSNIPKAFEILEQREKDVIVIIHAEDPVYVKDRNLSESENQVRPVRAETEAIHQVIEWSDQFPELKCHVTHVSSYSGAKILLDQSNLSWDVLPKHIAFNETIVDKIGNYGKMNPPLRSEEERVQLFNLFCENKIPILTSDHAPHTRKDKISSVAGAPGVQELYPFLIDQHLRGNISLSSLLSMIYKNPKNLLSSAGLQVREGKILVDPEGQTLFDKDSILSKANWSLWEGFPLLGKILSINLL